MKLLAIDGNSLINRAFYGIRLLTTKDGRFTNGIYGFINMLNRVLEQESPQAVAVAFDLKKPTFRHEMYAEYKAGRKQMPEELAEQMPVLKQWLSLMGYTVLSCEGYEADDILGTLADICEKSGNECIIATGDRDALQLVSDNTTLLNTVTKMGKPEIVRYDPAAIMEKYGVVPKRMIDIKALQGDSSDNIPGVAGIGEKTACMLVSSYGGIDDIYSNLDSLPIKDGLRKKLAEGKESAYLSRTLGTISKEVPIDKNPESYLIKPQNRPELLRLMASLEFFSLIKKMGLENEQVMPENQSETVEYKLFEKLPSENTDKAVPDAICFFENTAAVCRNGGVAVMDILSEEFNKYLLEETNKNVYDSKTAYKLCRKNGLTLENVCFDGMLAGYLCSPSASGYDIERLAKEYEAPVCVLPDGAPKEALLAAQYFEASLKLIEKIRENGQEELLKTIELPLAKVLADMESYGFSVDTDGIKAYGEQLEERITELQNAVWFLGGGEFNINSPKQLGVVLFEKLGLPAKKKTKSGYSTNAEVLESLVGAHPIIENILEYRKLAKLKSTYCDGLITCADENGRIHSTLNQTETRTGRISSQDPNLQNIPVRTEEGRQLRRYFRAAEGYTLIDSDYSQIELRVLSHMANDQTMINAFLEGVDIHTVTASEVFGLPKEMITPELRSRAKAVNFGIVYGIGAFSLAKDIGVSRKTAAEYIEGYLRTYSGVAKFMEETVEKARKTGYTTTLFSRRRYLPELTASNAILRAAGERIARNMPIQGTAADIIKIAMVRVSKRFVEEKLDAHLIMQVHDELIVEAKEDIAEKVAEIVTNEMQNAVKLSVPLIVDTGYGKTWYDAKG